MSEKLIVKKIGEFGLLVFSISALYVLFTKTGNILLVAFVGIVLYPLGRVIKSRSVKQILLASAFLGLGVFCYEIRVSVLLMLAGMFLNFLVIRLNGKMPTFAETFESADPIEQERYIPITKETKLRFLADVLRLRDPTMAFSVGDVIAIGSGYLTLVEVYFKGGF